MCTKEEAKDAVHEVLFDRSENGETVIGREVNRHIDVKAKSIIFHVTVRVAIPLLMAVLAGSAAWYTLRSEVEQNTQTLQETQIWTFEDHDRYADTQRQRLNDIERRIDGRLSNIESMLDTLLKSRF